MKKKVIIDERTKTEIHRFPYSVQLSFEGYFNILAEEGRLEYPDAKKVRKGLFEIRIKSEGEYRGLYAYVEKQFIVILHAFRKKTQKIPIKSLKVAERRLKEYE